MGIKSYTKKKIEDEIIKKIVFKKTFQIEQITMKRMKVKPVI
jgi:hypothetical protein